MRNMFNKISTQPLDRVIAYIWLGVVTAFFANMIVGVPVSKSELNRWIGQGTTAIASVQPR